MAPSVTALVIDNASDDRTLDEVRVRKTVRLIANQENRGFAAAVNQGVAAVDAECYLMLNPDVYLRTTITPLIDATKQYGLASGKLLDETGQPQLGFTLRRFPTPLTLWFELCGLNRIWRSNPINRRYRYLDRDLDAPGPVEQPPGAFLMFQKAVWQTIGELDEGFYPIWFEDVDFCLRASEAGYKIQYVPSVTAEHSGGHSISRLGAGCRLYFWCASLLRYAAKHFQPSAYRGMCLAVLLTCIPRAVAGMIQEHSLTPAYICIKIIGFAGRRLLSSPWNAREGPKRFHK